MTSARRDKDGETLKRLGGGASSQVGGVRDRRLLARDASRLVVSGTMIERARVGWESRMGRISTSRVSLLVAPREEWGEDW